MVETLHWKSGKKKQWIVNIDYYRRQVKYNVQPDWFNQIITVYLIGQFRPRSEMISYHFTGIIFSHGFITLISTHNM